MASNNARFDAVRSLPIASITADYTPLGIPFTHAMRVVHFINDTNGTFMISFDGVTDNVPLISNNFGLYDLSSDQDSNESFRYDKGTQLYIKFLIAPTVVAGQTDTVYAVSVYGRGE